MKKTSLLVCTHTRVAVHKFILQWPILQRVCEIPVVIRYPIPELPVFAIGSWNFNTRSHACIYTVFCILFFHFFSPIVFVTYKFKIVFLKFHDTSTQFSLLLLWFIFQLYTINLGCRKLATNSILGAIENMNFDYIIILLKSKQLYSLKTNNE